MKKVIKEQGVKPYPTPKNDEPSKTTFDLFSDISETEIFKSSIVITNVEKGLDVKSLIVSVRTNPNIIGGETFKGTISFDCKTGEMIAKGILYPVPRPGSPKPTPITNKRVFSKELSKFISNKWCRNQISENKKVIRLTESDLVRLVKRIIKENDEAGRRQFNAYETKMLLYRGFKLKDNNTTAELLSKKIIVKPSLKHVGQYGGLEVFKNGVLKFDLPHDDCDVELDNLLKQ